jgi:hypothetical protein
VTYTVVHSSVEVAPASHKQAGPFRTPINGSTGGDVIGKINAG